MRPSLSVAFQVVAELTYDPDSDTLCQHVECHPDEPCLEDQPDPDEERF